MSADEQKKELPRECRFAIHMAARRPGQNDLHLVKEAIHNEDGTVTPNIRFIKDYKRPIYVTKKQYQDHEQKKESEKLDRLVRHVTTQSNIDRTVARALDQNWSSARLQQLSASPYLYGSDISSTSLIKREYKKKFPDAVSPYSVAYLDFETSMFGPKVLNDTGFPIIGTLICGKTLTIGVVEEFVAGFSDIYTRILDKVKVMASQAPDKHEYSMSLVFEGDQAILRMTKEKRETIDLKIEILLVKNGCVLVQELIARVHKESPDFLAIWNMDFDVNVMLETLNAYNVDPKTVFSHPTIPEQYQFCAYKKGSTKKVTASGKVKPKNPSEQWHSLHCPAGFYIIDAMCSYRFVRQGAQEETSYGLDAIVKKEEVGKKYVIPEAEGLKGPDYHIVMQSKFKFEYIAYAVMDVIAMMSLELKTNDLSQSVPIQSGFTDFARYNSQTKRFADAYHFFLEKFDEVVGTIPPKAKKEEGGEDAEDDGEEDDDELEDIDESVRSDDDDAEPQQKRSGTLSLRDWIKNSPFTV